MADLRYQPPIGCATVAVAVIASFASNAATPDPEPELQRLSSTERINITAQCRTYTNSAAAYRQGVWKELGQLGIFSSGTSGIAKHNEAPKRYRSIPNVRTAPRKPPPSHPTHSEVTNEAAHFDKDFKVIKSGEEKSKYPHAKRMGDNWPRQHAYEKKLSSEKNRNPNQELSKAAINGDFDSARWAIDQGADVNATTLWLTPLYYAAGQGHTDIVKLLLKHGAKINALNGPAQRIALQEAVLHGQLSTVKVLVLSGADINARNKFGRTPLFYETSPPLPLKLPYNHRIIAAFLKEHSAN